MQKFFKNISGMSMIEVMISLTIISVGLSAMLGLANYTIMASKASSGFLTASMLAQEGLELVRNVRDDNYNKGLAYNAGIYNSSDSTFTIDYSRGINFTPNVITGAVLYMHNGFYDYNSNGAVTPFHRLITISNTSGSICDDPDKCLVVRSEVAWQSGDRGHTYVAETMLTEWR
jgi:prepilin-type N-terminal cleavage/methylation domain-containing protein